MMTGFFDASEALELNMNSPICEASQKEDSTLASSQMNAF